MPNVKIYVDHAVWNEHETPVKAALSPIRDLLCHELKVDVSACQLAILPVHGLADQPAVNLEIMILPRPERTREAVTDVCGKLRALLTEASGGAHVAIRAAALDPETYIALK